MSRRNKSSLNSAKAKKRIDGHLQKINLFGFRCKQPPDSKRATLALSQS